MKFCKKCKKEIDDEFQYCPHCGQSLEKEKQTGEKKPNIIAAILGIIAATAFTIYVCILILGGLDGNKSISNSSNTTGYNEDTKLTVQYEEDPITGEKHITSINNQTKEDAVDSAMDWLGFEKK